MPLLPVLFPLTTSLFPFIVARKHVPTKRQDDVGDPGPFQKHGSCLIQSILGLL